MDNRVVQNSVSYYIYSNPKVSHPSLAQIYIQHVWSLDGWFWAFAFHVTVVVKMVKDVVFISSY